MKKKLLKLFFGINFAMLFYMSFGQVPAACTLDQGNSSSTDSAQVYIGMNANADSVIVFYRTDSVISENPLSETVYQVGDVLIDGAICIYKGPGDRYVSAPANLESSITFFKAYSFRTSLVNETSTLRYSYATSYIGRTALKAPLCFNADTEPQMAGGTPLIGWGKTTTRTFMFAELNLPAPAIYCISDYNGKVLYNNYNGVTEGFSAISPYIIFKDNSLLKQVSLDLNSYSYMPLKGGGVNILANNREFSINDSVLIDVSADGLHWDRVHVFTKDSVRFNSDGIDVPYSFTFKNESPALKFRFIVKAVNGGMICISDICIKEVPTAIKDKDCRYPAQMNILSEQTSSESIKIEWTDNNRFDAEYYVVQYGDTSVQAQENPFSLTGLNPGSLYKINIRSQCSSEPSDSSQWHPFPLFAQTLGEIPYLPNFQNYAQKCSSSAAYLPSWKRYSYKIVDSMLTEKVKAIEDHTNKGTNIQLNTADIASVHYSISSLPTPSFQQLLSSPAVKIQKKRKLSVLIDMSFDTYAGGTNLIENGLVYILYSKDGGRTWKKSDTLAVYGKQYRDQSELLDKEASSRSYPFTDLENTNELAIGIYVEASSVNKPFYLRINQFELRDFCEAPSSVEVLDIKADSASIVYQGSSSIGILEYWKSADESNVYTQAMEDRSIRIGGLEEGMEYSFSIRGICGEDTSEYTLGSFTSFSILCEEPSQLKSGLSQYKSISLKWQGSSESYNLVWQKDLDEKWDTIKEITDTTYTLTGLTYNAKYWVKIQGNCGKKQTEYTEAKAFYTKYLECSIPSGLNATSTTTPVRVYIHWPSTSSEYEARWKRAEDSEWNVKYLISAQLEFNTTPETDYEIQVRSFCLTIDTTDWSDTLRYTSGKLEDCEMPTKLSAEEIREQSALLSWETSSTNFTIQFYGRKQGTEEFSEKINLNMRKEYWWEFLEKSTVYEWKIRSICYGLDTTEWSPLKSFKTQGLAIEEEKNTEDLFIYSKNGKIIVENLSDKKISLLEVLNIQGQRIYATNTITKNPTEIEGIKEKGIVMIRLSFLDNTIKTYKINLW